MTDAPRTTLNRICALLNIPEDANPDVLVAELEKRLARSPSNVDFVPAAPKKPKLQATLETVKPPIETESQSQVKTNG